MAGERSALLPGGTFPLTLVYGARLVAKREWFNSLFHRWTLTRPRPQGLAAVAPRDRRPGSVMLGRAILAGRFELGGKVLDTGNRGDPWDRASPSRAFAVALHRLGWMNDLMALGPTAHAEALRLTLDWSRVFGRWNKFSWNPQVLERRVFNLACHLPTLSAVASDAERALMTYDLVRQTRHLLSTIDGPFRAAEQAAAVTLAGAILAGPVGKRLVALGLRRLDLALPIAVAADGGHASRSARAGLELLLDLQVLEQALGERGMPVSMVVVEAMARLAEAARFFTLQDGALPDLQGSDCGRAANVAAAKIQARDGPMAPACNGFHRLDGKNLQVMVDAAPPVGALVGRRLRSTPGHRCLGAGTAVDRRLRLVG